MPVQPQPTPAEVTALRRQYFNLTADAGYQRGRLEGISCLTLTLHNTVWADAPAPPASDSPDAETGASTQQPAARPATLIPLTRERRSPAASESPVLTSATARKHRPHIPNSK